MSAPFVVTYVNMHGGFPSGNLTYNVVFTPPSKLFISVNFNVVKRQDEPTYIID